MICEEKKAPEPLTEEQLWGAAPQVDSGVRKAIEDGPKPITVGISTADVAALFACNTDPYQYMQLILAKLKDAGVPVEGTLHLKLAHGKVFKVKTNPLVEQSEFKYLWLPEAYVLGLAQMGGVQ